MKRTIVFSLLLVGLFLSLLAVSQAGLVDEDFEGAAAFVDQNYPTRGSTTLPPTPAMIAVQGVHLRAYANDAGNTNKLVYSATGTQTTSRFFRGLKSYKLTGTQAITFSHPADGANIQAANTPQLIQFALSTDAATAGLAVGTKIGHFKIDFSLTNTALVQDSAVFNFVVAAGGKLSVVSADNGATIKTIDCGPGFWTLLSFAVNEAIPNGLAVGDASRNSNTGWLCYDPLTLKHKGLQPINPAVPPANPTVAADFNTFGTGIQVFADANTTVTTVRPNDMDPAWGLDGVAGGTWETWIQGWEIAPENGGVLYIDDLCWNSDSFAGPNDAWAQELAARMDEFTVMTIEPAGPPVASARDWDLY